jgi:hypothetical protein
MILVLKCIQSSTTAIAFGYSLFLSFQYTVILVGATLAISLVCFIICDLFVAKVDVAHA